MANPPRKEPMQDRMVEAVPHTTILAEQFNTMQQVILEEFIQRTIDLHENPLCIEPKEPVTPTTPTSMAVNVQVDTVYKDGLLYQNVGINTTLQIDPAHSVYMRFDRVILGIDRSNDDELYVEVLKGTACAEPEPPPEPEDASTLAIIRVRPGATTIEEEDINPDKSLVNIIGQILKELMDYILSLSVNNIEMGLGVKENDWEGFGQYFRHSFLLDFQSTDGITTFNNTIIADGKLRLDTYEAFQYSNSISVDDPYMVYVRDPDDNWPVSVLLVGRRDNERVDRYRNLTFDGHHGTLNVPGASAVGDSLNNGGYINEPVGVLAHASNPAPTERFIYIVDKGNQRVIRVVEEGSSSNWEIDHQFGQTGSPGSGSSGLTNPNGIDLYNNKVYVVDSGNKRIVELNLDLTYSTEYNLSSISTHKPFDIVVFDDGGNTKAVVSFPDENIVRKIDLSSMSVEASYDGTIGTNTANTPMGVTRDSSGNIYVAYKDSHVVVKLNSSLAYQGHYGELNVSGSDTEHLNEPVGLSFSSAEEVLYIADTQNNRVMIVEPLSEKYYTSGYIETEEITASETIVSAIAVLEGEIPPDTSVKVYYSTDGGTTWIECTSKVWIPPEQDAEYIDISETMSLKFKIELLTNDDSETPRIDKFGIMYATQE